jgi:hypothetical protein
VLNHEASEEERVIGNLVSRGFLENSFLSLKRVVIYLRQDFEVPKGQYEVEEQQLRENGEQEASSLDQVGQSPNHLGWSYKDRHSSF